MSLLTRLYAPLLLVLFTASPIPSLAANSASDDESAIRDLASRWQTAWNAHDMKAMATLLTTDADFVNVAGRHWKGKPQIELEHAERHQTNLKNSVWVTRNVSIRLLSPTLALAHVDWGITGDTDFDGTPREPREGIFSWLVVKQGDQWLIRSAHNTNKAARK